MTKEGEELQQYAKSLKANSERIMPLLQRIKNQSKKLNFGATLTIGEYTIPPILSKIISQDHELQISMVVENTQILQKMLWDGEVDFVLLEGHFNREQFESKLICNEPFIAVCSPKNKIADDIIDFVDLLEENLILREKGSGTRDILVKTLYNQNLSIKNFKHHIELGNMNAIKYLCHENVGVTFMYKEAVKNELSQGYLKEIRIRNFNVTHPFSFIYLKNCPDKDQIEYWYEKIKSLRTTNDKIKMY